MIARILTGTFLSILIFFSISFITVLPDLNSPFYRQTDAILDIGFPFTYYEQFIVDPPIPNSSWNIGFLILDCLLTWLVITGMYWLLSRQKQATGLGK